MISCYPKLQAIYFVTELSWMFPAFCFLYYLLVLIMDIFFSGKPSFTKKQADLFFPPDFADDFPVSMQVSV